MGNNNLQQQNIKTVQLAQVVDNIAPYSLTPYEVVIGDKIHYFPQKYFITTLF